MKHSLVCSLHCMSEGIVGQAYIQKPIVTSIPVFGARFSSELFGSLKRGYICLSASA